MYPYSVDLGLKGVPMWVLLGLCIYFLGAWSVKGKVRCEPWHESNPETVLSSDDSDA